MYTIGEISKKFSLSRSTLLYYDSIGLLKPSGRSESNYRLYSNEDILKMERISIFREAGLPLKSIVGLLQSDNNDVDSILENQLERINGQIHGLRSQQTVILRMLKSENTIKYSKVITKEQWVSLMRATGLNEDDMNKWHIEFERMSPEAHQDFLESLGIKEREIKIIRRLSNGKEKI